MRKRCTFFLWKNVCSIFVCFLCLYNFTKIQLCGNNRSGTFLVHRLRLVHFFCFQERKKSAERTQKLLFGKEDNHEQKSKSAFSAAGAGNDIDVQRHGLCRACSGGKYRRNRQECCNGGQCYVYGYLRPVCHYNRGKLHSREQRFGVKHLHVYHSRRHRAQR